MSWLNSTCGSLVTMKAMSFIASSALGEPLGTIQYASWLSQVFQSILTGLALPASTARPTRTRPIVTSPDSSSCWLCAAVSHQTMLSLMVSIFLSARSTSSG